MRNIRSTVLRAITAPLALAVPFVLPTVLCLSAATATAQNKVAVRAGKIIPVVGDPIEDAYILIENGRITAITKDAEPGWDYTPVDASKHVVMPAYVLAHTSGGLSGGTSERMENVPFLSVADAIDPSTRQFEEWRRNGVGTAHVMPGNRTLFGGTGMVITTSGKTVQDMALRTRTALKLSLGTSDAQRVSQLRKLRTALSAAQRYGEDQAARREEFDKAKAAGALGEDEEFEENENEQLEPLLELLNKDLKGFAYVHSAAVSREALRMARQMDLSLVLGQDTWKALPLMARGLRGSNGVILEDDLEWIEVDPDTGARTEMCFAAMAHQAGLPFAMSLGRGPAGYPWWQMGTAIRYGVPRQTALESMTIVPARILGMEGEVGSIEVGKRADLQILTGDPLEATTWVDRLLLGGEVVYEKANDRTLQYLFGETDKPATEEAEESSEGDGDKGGNGGENGK